MNPTLDFLTRERERIRIRYTDQISLLDSLICRLETGDPTPQEPAAPQVNAVNPVTAVPVIQAPARRPLRLARANRPQPDNAPDPTATPHRRSPVGSKTTLIRQAILDHSGPFTAAEIATATSLPKPTVSGFMSNSLARGELERAGTRNDLQLYKPTNKFQRPDAQPAANGVEQEYSKFRDGLNIKLPEIKLGFTEREEP